MLKPTVAILRKIPDERRWWVALLWVDLIGSAYGFWWYREQLQATPIKYWLLVPDSPGSTLLFAVFLAVLLAGRARRVTGWAGVLAAVAFVSNLKYGLWTAIVLPTYAWRAGDWTADIFYLSLSHLGMWLQALLFARRYRPGASAGVLALGWMLFQDWVDYWLLGIHPTLPAAWIEPFARATAVTLSLAWGAYLIGLARRSHKASA